MVRINDNIIIYITILRQPLAGIFNTLYNFFYDPCDQGLS